MVTLESIKNTFEKMQDDGVNTSKDLLWGYFFTDKNKDALKEFGEYLVKSGYILNGIYQDDKGEYWWLNVEKKETHTPEMLFKRCKEFYSLAEKNNLNSFDGYDVGNPEKGKPITEVK